VLPWSGIQVCAEQQCEDEVFPLSVNYLDRVLSVLAVRRSQLQLLAAVCMFIASKFKDTTPLSSHCLVVYTDCSITVGDLLVRSDVCRNLSFGVWSLNHISPPLRFPSAFFLSLP